MPENGRIGILEIIWGEGVSPNDRTSSQSVTGVYGLDGEIKHTILGYNTIVNGMHDNIECPVCNVLTMHLILYVQPIISANMSFGKSCTIILRVFRFIFFLFPDRPNSGSSVLFFSLYFTLRHRFPCTYIHACIMHSWAIARPSPVRQPCLIDTVCVFASLIYSRTSTNVFIRTTICNDAFYEFSASKQRRTLYAVRAIR